MSQKANHFKIGVFMICSAVLGLAAVIIFGGGLLKPEPFRFETYFDASVTGLNVGSSVVFRGVQHGRVESVGLVARKYPLERDTPDWRKFGHYVVVVIAIERDAVADDATEEVIERSLEQMVSDGLRLRLSSQGITGIMYLDGDYLDPERYKRHELPWTPRHFYIPSAPSAFASIGESLDTLTRKLGELDFKALFGRLDETLTGIGDTARTLDKNISLLSGDLRVTTKRVNELLGSTKIDSILTDASATASSLRTAAAKIDPAVANAREAIARLKSVADEIEALFKNGKLESILANIDKASMKVPDATHELVSVLRKIDNLVASQSKDIDEAVTNIRLLTDGLRELTQGIKKFPAHAFFGNPPAKSTAGKK